MFSDSDGLPTIRVIPTQAAKLPRTTDPPDLRWQRVEEFWQARSLAPESQKAYRRELKRFLQWSDRPWAEVTPLDNARSPH